MWIIGASSDAADSEFQFTRKVQESMERHNTRPTGKAAQPYDERFAGAEPHSKTDEGMVKAIRDFECEICVRRTEWVHPKLAVYLCSRDCLTRYEPI